MVTTAIVFDHRGTCGRLPSNPAFPARQFQFPDGRKRQGIYLLLYNPYCSFSEFTVCVADQFFSFLPADTAVGNRYIGQRFAAGRNILSAFAKMTFQHHADNGFFAGGNLIDHIAENLFLPVKAFAAVGMTAVDDNLRRQTCLFHCNF